MWSEEQINASRAWEKEYLRSLTQAESLQIFFDLCAANAQVWAETEHLYRPGRWESMRILQAKLSPREPSR